ncbi:MAG: response regulator transcription factor [Minwuia sp.]|uniref:response regulator transcription factor n=1 Tax=Minwuia sp. TaxID=2493630 RepID=UPI003A8BF6D3
MADGALIFIVDDDDLFRESVSQNLGDDGFTVEEFPDGPEVLERLKQDPKPSLILLDWKMPRMNGIEVLKTYRGDGGQVPVIFLTVLSDQIYEEAALIGGAVDFIEKSRSFSILRRRIDLIVGGKRGQSEAPAEGLLEIGGLALDPDSARARWRGKEVDLTVAEFSIVHHLAARQGRDCRYRELYDLVRGEGFHAGAGEDGFRTNVRSMIKRVRRKFENLDADFAEIENYPGFGYRWRRPEDR